MRTEVSNLSDLLLVDGDCLSPCVFPVCGKTPKYDDNDEDYDDGVTYHLDSSVLFRL